MVEVPRVRREEEAHESNATVMGVVRFARRLSVPDVVLRAGGAAVRVRPWPADQDDGAGAARARARCSRRPRRSGRWLTGLSRLGYHRVRTAALGPHDQRPVPGGRARPAGGAGAAAPAARRRDPRRGPPRAATAPCRVGAAARLDAAAFADEWHLDRGRHPRRLPGHASPPPAGGRRRCGTGRLRRPRPRRRHRLRPAAGRAPRGRRAGLGHAPSCSTGSAGWRPPAAPRRWSTPTSDNERALRALRAPRLRAASPTASSCSGSRCGTRRERRPSPRHRAGRRRGRPSAVAALAGRRCRPGRRPRGPRSSSSARSWCWRPRSRSPRRWRSTGTVPDGAELVGHRLVPAPVLRGRACTRLLDDGGEARRHGRLPLRRPGRRCPTTPSGRLSVTIPTVRRSGRRPPRHAAAQRARPLPGDLRAAHGAGRPGRVAAQRSSSAPTTRWPIVPMSVALVASVEQPARGPARRHHRRSTSRPAPTCTSSPPRWPAQPDQAQPR